MDDARSTLSAAAGSDDSRQITPDLTLGLGHDNETNSDGDPGTSETMRFPWSSQSASASITPLPHVATDGAVSSSGKPTVHKKSLSGNILSKFNLSRNIEDGKLVPRDEQDQDAESFKPRKSTDDDDNNNGEEPFSSISPVKGEHALAAALRPIKTRRRKGSLRKTALLGGKRLANEGRERRNSLLQRSPTSKSSAASVFQPSNAVTTPSAPLDLDDDRGPSRLHRRFGHDALHPASSSESGWSESAAATTAKLSLVTDHKIQTSESNDTNDLGSPLDLKSPTSQTSYTSTTDDDDVLTFDRPANAYIAQQREGIPLNPLPSSATGYFSPVSSRRSSKQSRSSPLSHSISALSSYPEPEPHDYTETEYWGWVILFVTWLTFAVGMGSCLEIWSWAWDVGETPYAPPELEDDPTLPIVGYYPALIVLTGVVAWVWITVAWVGMKYFRHAKIEV